MKGPILNHATSSRVIDNVLQHARKMLKIINPCFRETPFPHGRLEPEFFAGAKSETAFDELNGSFNTGARINTDEYVKVIGHDNEGMKKISSLVAVMVQNVNKQSSRSIRLQQITLRSNRGCDEKRSLRGNDICGSGASEWDRHNRG